MDTSKLDNFVDIVECRFHHIRVKKLIKQGGIQECIKNIRQTERLFEKGVVELCLKYGDKTDKVLGIYRDRLICGFKTTQRIINRQDLFSSCTEKELWSIRLYYAVLTDQSLKAIKYISKILKIDYRQDLQDKKKITSSINDANLQNTTNTDTKEITANKVANVHYMTTFSDKKLKKVYDYLIENGHLEKDTLLSDFIYFFTGRGKKVNNGLRWSSKTGEKVNLAFFLQAIIGDDPKAKVWKKAEDIFGKKGLAQSYSEAPETSLHARKISRDIQRLIK